MEQVDHREAHIALGLAIDWDRVGVPIARVQVIRQCPVRIFVETVDAISVICDTNKWRVTLSVMVVVTIEFIVMVIWSHAHHTCPRTDRRGYLHRDTEHGETLRSCVRQRPGHSNRSISSFSRCNKDGAALCFS